MLLSLSAHPFEQFVHDVAAIGEYCPALHATHAVAALRLVFTTVVTVVVFTHPEPLSRLRPAPAVGLAVGLALGLAVGLALGLVVGLVVGLDVGLVVGLAVGLDVRHVRACTTTVVL